MTPEQIAHSYIRQELFNHVAQDHGISLLETEMNDIANIILKPSVEAITQLQEQVTELENHNKDKSQLLANYKDQLSALNIQIAGNEGDLDSYEQTIENYKEQIKELVKQKYKAPPLPPIGIEKHRREK